jgi:hypothetical protein
MREGLIRYIGFRSVNFIDRERLDERVITKMESLFKRLISGWLYLKILGCNCRFESVLRMDTDLLRIG